MTGTRLLARSPIRIVPEQAAKPNERTNNHDR